MNQSGTSLLRIFLQASRLGSRDRTESLGSVGKRRQLSAGIEQLERRNLLAARTLAVIKFEIVSDDADLDFDGDGAIDGMDFGYFRKRMGGRI